MTSSTRDSTVFPVVSRACAPARFLADSDAVHPPDVGEIKVKRGTVPKVEVHDARGVTVVPNPCFRTAILRPTRMGSNCRYPTERVAPHSGA